MIRSMAIRNFQAHSRLTLSFSDTVTSIVGPSDVGKSAIIRALRWVAFNRPVGQAFIRDGTERAEVVVVCDEHTIERGKGKGGNHYIIDGRALGALGNDVPTRVQEILSLTEDNFQSQHDSPFWFSETAGEVSRRLNEIMNLGLMDTVMSNLASRLRKTRTEQEVLAGRVAAAVSEVRSLSRVPALVSGVEALAAEQAEVVRIAEKAITLTELYRAASAHQDRAARLAQAKEGGFLTVECGRVWEDLIARRQFLSELVGEVVQLEQQVRRRVPDITTVEAALDTLKGIGAGVEDLEDAIADALRAQKVHSDLCDSKVQAEAQLKKVIGKECPLCGQKIR